MRHNPAAGAIIIMLRSLKMHGMAQAVGELTEQGSPAFEAALPILSQLLKAETADREVRSTAYQLKAARFPSYRDLAGFYGVCREPMLARLGHRLSPDVVQLIGDFEPEVIMLTPSYMLTLLDELPPKTAVLCTSNCKEGELEERFHTRFVLEEVDGPTPAQIAEFLAQWPLLEYDRQQIANFACGNVRQALRDAQKVLLGYAGMQKAA